MTRIIALVPGGQNAGDFTGVLRRPCQLFSFYDNARALIASSARFGVVGAVLNLNWLGPGADTIIRDVPRADPPPVEKQSYARHAQA
jgi:hypothetical protein